MNTSTITIVGVGLIGGSLGLAIKKKKLADRVVGVDVNPENLCTAESIHAIDDGTDDLRAGVAPAQLVIVATPMHYLAEQLAAAANAASEGALITDTGSCKAQLVQVSERNIAKKVRFVGAHPLAGSEKSGPKHANGRLFENRVAVITPTKNTNSEALEFVRSFWKSIGSKTVEMSPEAHDEIVARTSHAPHLTAAALSGTLSDECGPLVATGFLGTTRIAAGDPRLWTAIFQQNRNAVLNALAPIESRLAEFRTALECCDWETVEHLLNHAKKVRDALGN